MYLIREILYREIRVKYSSKEDRTRFIDILAYIIQKYS
jgi:hypothetical protein